MSIPTGAQRDTLKAAALDYLMDGTSVIPLIGKRAAIRWEIYQVNRAQLNQVGLWATHNLLQNVGVVCGQVSGGLVVIDLDGLNAIALFERQFPALLDTFTVATGSGQGKHLYLYVDDLPRTTRALNIPGGGNIELRADGCYVVAPPSIHPKTHCPYRIDRLLPLRRLPNLEMVTNWLHRVSPAKATESAVWVRKPNQRAIGGGYTVTALSGEIAALQQSTEGNRNNRLNRAAYNLGQLVGDNRIPRWQVEDDLLAAALAVGLPEGESRRTIKSGLEAGMRNPRSRRHG